MSVGETYSSLQLDQRVEDILTMYSAGVMARMEDCYRKSLQWAHTAERAAYQFGLDAGVQGCEVSFGISVLDKAFRRGVKETMESCSDLVARNDGSIGVTGSVMPA
ncbi:hypothetical protein [Kistimonas asteriae]|uniref:hypothetical protein n=1 Tax=Kistimonas asteriae TaxID=517724 RepID=UPI001BA87E4B|nr:hypothetical protein [Kistimonas asteriae]